MLEAYVWCMVSNNDNTYNQILLENYNQLIVKKKEYRDSNAKTFEESILSV